MGHRIQECRSFKSLSVDGRWKCVQSGGLCRNCLNSHGKRSCRKVSFCGTNGCQFRHHPLLHSSRSNNETTSQAVVNIVSRVNTAENYTLRVDERSLLFKILPVTLHGPKGKVETFAFLDDGSTLTLVEDSLVEQLGVCGIKKPLCLLWTANITRVEKDSKQFSLVVSAAGGRKYSLEEVQTVKELSLPIQTLSFRHLTERYAYLKRLPVTSYTNAVPKILIGVNNLSLMVSLKIKEGLKREPVAVKTRLGWCIYGGEGANGQQSSVNCHACGCASDQALHELVKDFFTKEDVGMQIITPLLSDQEKRASRILEETTVRVGARYETGLLWKHDHIELPDSYNMALRRLECLERKMSRNPELKQALHKQIEDYQQKGYAHRATVNEIGGADLRRVWYLPLGVVVNPRKPGKVRLIWDTKATHDGFELRNWLSNSNQVLIGLGEPLPQRNKKFTPDKTSEYDRVLGMLWSTHEDVFSFSIEMKPEIETLIRSNERPTKRQMLRCLMSLFDPLGLLGLFLVHGKILLQEVWRAGIQWDEKVNDDLHRSIRYKDLQLHIFVDASESAYCATAYFRTLNSAGMPEIVLVAAKTKVAPLKTQSIPRLELQAAVLGARLMQFVEENHAVPITKRVLWTDSATNPADIATKWGKGPNVVTNSVLFTGPVFLLLTETEWPKQVTLSSPTEEELRPCYSHKSVPFPTRIVELERFLQLNRAIRAVANVYRFDEILKQRTSGQKPSAGPLTSEELQKAERHLIRETQWQSFPDEMVVLSRYKLMPVDEQISIGKSSNIYQLCPTLDENGILRVDGRIGEAPNLKNEVKFPVILANKHPFTVLLVDSYHRRFGKNLFADALHLDRGVPSMDVPKLTETLTRACFTTMPRKLEPKLNPTTQPTDTVRRIRSRNRGRYAGLQIVLLSVANGLQVKKADDEMPARRLLPRQMKNPQDDSAAQIRETTNRFIIV
ncbi:uncharacterized protein LOC131680868 [Topomyia yanbarensis]|uniref:uncharacterized protein LOC131680868 n=1 Tax=Topomyia yanbarensis TaxID=2498891 RepID=UPI00273B76BE|nr:uncharacterized protein LOC131680868 [Topomyia yanbarensis]